MLLCWNRSSKTLIAIPHFNLGIPTRFASRSSSATSKTGSPDNTSPPLIVIRLPNDHTTKPRPLTAILPGFLRADNDLALGASWSSCRRAPSGKIRQSLSLRTCQSEWIIGLNAAVRRSCDARPVTLDPLRFGHRPQWTKTAESFFQMAPLDRNSTMRPSARVVVCHVGSR